MPLVAHSDLPSFARLRAEGEDILDADRARHQDIRELHIGLLNMMPDTAVEATERQFLRLLGECNRIAQFYVHPFTVRGMQREGAAAEHVERYYERFEDVRRDGLDALIITGANPREPDITRESFWDGMMEVMDWAREQVCSTIMSCLATHAALKRYHGVDRRALGFKRWGVYSHRVVEPTHPLVNDINTRFDTCHSRFNDVPGDIMRATGSHVLVESEECGVLLATSPDGLRFIYLQGHPEYDRVSLLKEYKREIANYTGGLRNDYPPFPDNYFPAAARQTLLRYREQVVREFENGRAPPPFPEEQVLSSVDNTWTDTGKAIFNNWMGLVYQLTSRERGVPFMEGVDPDDPLGLRTRHEP